MKMYVHALLLCGAVSVVWSLRSVRAEYYMRDFRKIGSEAAVKRSREIENRWRKLRYVDLASTETHAACLTRLDSSAATLAEVQRSKLTPRIEQVLHYLERPELEEYFRLKTEGLHYGFALVARGRKLLEELPDSNTSRTPKETVTLLWNKVHTHNGEVVVPKLGAICLDSVSGAISHTNSARELLRGEVRKGLTMAAEGLDPGFVYGNQDVARQEPLLFEFSFFAKAADSDRVGPVHISLLWVDKDQNWAPNRLITDGWLKFQTLF